MVAEDTFKMVHDTLEKQAYRPLVIIAGTSASNLPYKPSMDVPFRQHPSYETAVYAKCVKYSPSIKSSAVQTSHIWTSCSTSDVASILDNFQHPLLLFKNSKVMDYDIWRTIQEMPNTTFLTVSWAVATRVNNIVIHPIFQEKTPVSPITLENDTKEFFAYKDMRVVVTQNVAKQTGVINGQLATIVNSHNNTVPLEFPNGNRTLLVTIHIPFTLRKSFYHVFLSSTFSPIATQ